MRSACYWLPYLAALLYPTLHCTAQHSIGSVQSPKSRSILKNTCSKRDIYLSIYQVLHVYALHIHIYIHIYIHDTYASVCKRITLCLTLLYLPAVHVPRREERQLALYKNR